MRKSYCRLINLEGSAVLVTRNVGEFSRVEGLVVENWQMEVMLWGQIY